MTGASRRKLLVRIAYLTAMIPSLHFASRYLDPVLSRARTLANLLPSKSSAEMVGRAYLDIAPGEADLNRLVHLVDPGPAAANLGRAVGVRVRDDFAEGRIVRVQGWMLAESEARLAAICALLRDRALG